MTETGITKLKCVVCGKATDAGQAHYSNPWEKARKRFPCCGETCAMAFDPQRHWIPAVLPPAAASDEQRRLLAVVRHRLADGDRPSVVIREMLLAGVDPEGLRKLLVEASIATAGRRGTAKQMTMMGSVVGLLTGVWSVFGSRDKRDPEALNAALLDVDRWEHEKAMAVTPCEP
ncbi:MAG: hypothetical protein V2A73_08320 [Pseudomonadota bacterium]